ncbi:MAG: hypothetical protein WA624_03410, partial [Methylocella sp.]
PRSPRLRNPDQLRRGRALSFLPAKRGTFCTPIRGPDSMLFDTLAGESSPGSLSRILDSVIFELLRQDNTLF